MLLPKRPKKPEMKKLNEKKRPSYKLGLLAPLFRNPENGSVDELLPGSFPDIFDLEKTNLVYDKNTRIVYYGYVKSVKNMSDGEEFDMGFASTPYLSTNGNLCKFIDGRIVEVVELK